MNRKISSLSLLLLALALAACSGRPAASPTPAPEATALATATEFIAPTSPPVTVIVRETVLVPQTVVVTATPEPTQPVPTDTPPSATQAAPTPTLPPTLPPPTGPVSVELPAINSTPQALNGPDPLAGVTRELFAEYFSPPDFWGTGDDADSKVSIANGQLTIVNKKLRSFAWTLNGVKGQDFYVQAYMSPTLCGYGDNYGVAFRARDNANLDLFGISCEGRYRLLEISQGQTTTVVDWTDSKYIRKFETTNVVGVRAVGDQISLYVNNYYLATVTAGANLQGRFGLYVGNIKTPDLTVAFKALTAGKISP